MSLSPKMQSAKKWTISAIVASLGGGVAGAFTAAMNPSQYNFPHDFGSGKLWKFFFMGVGLTFGGMFLHSPVGQKLMGTYKAAQEQLAASQRDLKQAKADLKSCESQPDDKK